MNSSFFIARRYLISKKTHNVINLISGVSVFGIMVSTAALVILLSGFSGLENLMTSLYSDFYQDIKIVSKNTKTFDKSYVPKKVFQTAGLINYSEVIEEIVMVKYEDQYIFTSILGVESAFLEMSEMDRHLDDGIAVLEDDYGPLALIGTQALMSLDAYIYSMDGMNEVLTIFAPNKNERIKKNNLNAFTRSRIDMIGNFTFGTDGTDNYILVPIDFASEILYYGDEISSIEMDFDNEIDLEDKKLELQEILGSSFKVRTNFEQNELIYQTSRTEKWFTTLLLAFIFFLATFNMIATITMIVIEKRDNLNTLWALGAKKTQLEKIFFFEGLLINGIGMVLGLTIGYGICYLQQVYGLIEMEGGIIQYFPILFKLEDLLLILSITIAFGTLAAYVPSKVLVKRIIKIKK